MSNKAPVMYKELKGFPSVKILARGKEVIGVEGKKGYVPVLGSVEELEGRDLVWLVMRWLQHIGLPGYKSFDVMRGNVPGLRPEWWMQHVLKEEELHRRTKLKNLLRSKSGDCPFSERGRVQKIARQVRRVVFQHWEGKVRGRLTGRGLYLLTGTLPKVRGLTHAEAHEWLGKVKQDLFRDRLSPLSKEGRWGKQLVMRHWSLETTFRRDGTINPHIHIAQFMRGYLGGHDLKGDTKRNLVHRTFERPKLAKKRMKRGRKAEEREAAEVEDEARRGLLAMLGIEETELEERWLVWKTKYGEEAVWFEFIEGLYKGLQVERMEWELADALRRAEEREATEFARQFAEQWCRLVMKHAPKKALCQNVAVAEWLQDVRPIGALEGIDEYLAKGSFGLEMADGGWFKKARGAANMSLFEAMVRGACEGDEVALEHVCWWLVWRTGTRRLRLKGWSRGAKQVYSEAWSDDPRWDPPPSTKRGMVVKEHLIAEHAPWIMRLLSYSSRYEVEGQLRPSGLQMDEWLQREAEVNEAQERVVGEWLRWLDGRRKPRDWETSSCLLDAVWLGVNQGLSSFEGRAMKTFLDEGIGPRTIRAPGC